MSDRNRPDDTPIEYKLLFGFGVVGLVGWLGWQAWTSDRPRLRRLRRDVVDHLASAQSAAEAFVIPVAVCLCVGLLVWWVVRRLARLRRLRVEQLVAGIDHLVVDLDVDDVRVRWRWLTARRVKLRLSAADDWGKKSWRDRVAVAAGQRLGGRWDGEVRPPALTRHDAWLVLRPGTAGGHTTADEAISGWLDGLVPGPAVEVEGQQADGHPSVIRVRYGETTRDMSGQWRERVISQVQSRSGVKWRATWDTAKRTVQLDRVQPLPAVVPWRYPDEHRVQPSGSEPVCVLATDEEGRTVGWDLKAAPHGMIVGETNYGKSVMVRAALAGLIQQGTLLLICDMKAREYLGFLGKPGVACVATDVVDIVRVWIAMKQLVDRRVAADALGVFEGRRDDVRVERVGESELDDVSVVLVVDEITETVTQIDKWWRGLSKVERQEWGVGDGAACPFLNYPADITRIARSVRCHMLFSGQRADAKNWGDSTEMRSNLSFRTSVGRQDRFGSEMTWGDPVTGRIAVEGPGEGVSNGRRYDDAGVALPSGRGRVKGHLLEDDVLWSSSFWDRATRVAPDASLVRLPGVSDAARSADAAIADFADRAGVRLIGEPADVLEKMSAVDDGADPSGERAGPVEDESGDTWAPVVAVDLAAGDVVQGDDDGEVTVVEPAEWVHDDLVDDEMVRLVVTNDGGERVWDLSPEDVLYRHQSS